MQRTFILLLLFCGASLFGFLCCSTNSSAVDPGPDTRCPVCGMFVSKYPNWIAQVNFQDGSADFFDGPKDMFRYLLDLKKFRAELDQGQVDTIFVTDYYTLKRIGARTAFFVIGGDVTGPMGKELVPFETEEAAEEFKADHDGERILLFSEVDPDCIDQLK